MTAAENKSTTARANRAFRFFVNGAEFFPGAGTRLHFASQSVDTLMLTDLPAGLLTPSASVSVTYKGTCVFRGTVEQIVDKFAGGDRRANDVTCQGPWGKMQRMIFRQQWGVDAASFKSSRVILNQSYSGARYTQCEQLREIVEAGAAKCGYSYAAGNVSGSDVVLPCDETRDITIGAAIQRELRFFPKSIVRFDYAAAVPVIHIAEPTGNADADYVVTIPKTARQYEYNAHPITGVYLYTEDRTTEFNGKIINESAQKYPVTADPDDIDCLSAYIPLARASASSSWSSFTSNGETIGEHYNKARWWKDRHPRLANIPAENITIQSANRSNSDYPYIASETSEEISAAGLHSAICRFTAIVKIETADDIEDGVILTLDYLTTDAVPKQRYTWQMGSSFSAAETIPEGLAEAVFRQRSGFLKNETMTIRLSDSFPVLGDMCDGLILQGFEVDCETQTASLHFGQPEYLSIDDMRGLLSGFRSRGFASNSPIRMGMGSDGEDGEEPFETCIKPLSSTEFCPGLKLKTVVGDETTGGKIDLDPSEIEGGTIKPHKLRIGSGESSGSPSAYILASEDITLPDSDVELEAGREGVSVGGTKIYAKVESSGEGAEKKYTVELSSTPPASPDKDEGCCNGHSNDREDVEPDTWSSSDSGSGGSGGGGGDGFGDDAGMGNGWSGDHCPLNKTNGE